MTWINPILQAPLLGSLAVAIAASLMGVVLLLRREVLLGEVLSHAAYPGLVIAMAFLGLFFGDSTTTYGQMGVIAGAAITAFLGFLALHGLYRFAKISQDAALCFVLSFFFGVGILFASHMQFVFPNLFRQSQNYFYGQVATMTDSDARGYFLLAVMVLGGVLFFYRPLQALLFDPIYCAVTVKKYQKVEKLFLCFVVLAVALGMRSIGVVLMSAMLVAPALAARQCSAKLSAMFAWAAFFGATSAVLGTLFAHYYSSRWLEGRFSLPTGPMIVLVASGFCLLALFFAPHRGILMTYGRAQLFRLRCLKENILKTLWRGRLLLPHLSWIQKYALYSLSRQGLIIFERGRWALTGEGEQQAARIVRLHRLWELYLASYVGMQVTQVHPSAEEMEHILTPELEQELTALLCNPTQDPHKQPIPPPTL